MNEQWVINMLMGTSPSGGGIPYDPASIDKQFSLGVDSNGRLYIKLSILGE